MNVLQDKLPVIAVFRGGKNHPAVSLSDGASILASLKRCGYDPADIVIEHNGAHLLNGLPVDEHMIVTLADGIVDTTYDHTHAYTDLARRAGVPVFFSREHTPLYKTEEDIYRVLRMAGITVPDTTVIRSATNSPEQLLSIWKRMHTPYLVRASAPFAKGVSTIVRSFQDFVHHVQYLQSAGHDVQVISYTHAPTYSLAVLPRYRGNAVYVPLPVMTETTKNEAPHKGSTIRKQPPLSMKEKDALIEHARAIYTLLQLEGPALVDCIYDAQGNIVTVGVDRSPSFHPEGRFMQSLSTTGVELGHYVHEHVMSLFTR